MAGALTAAPAAAATRPWAALLVLAATSAAVGLAYDAVVPGGHPGLGTAQKAALGLGALLAAGAGIAASPAARRRLSSHPVLLAHLAEAGALAGIALQLVLLVAIIVLFRIESPAFYERLAPLVLAGFVAHHLLPRPWRLGAFVVLSLGAIALVFGPLAGAWLVGLGLLLIIICRLPIPFGWRVALLVLAGAALALGRAGVVDVPWPGAIWAILASMFMFRLIAYMYDLRHARTPVGWRETLAYFFLLPNVAFPLFPVVDFATFRRTYYDQPPFAIYQTGVGWMARGLTHLIAYRFVYQHLTLSPADVVDLASLTQYALANFGLYLRVSGQFHLIVGILHLFGFRLPESHRFFYLASSFSDFWRRINIYWKDFMQKVVFYPVHFRLRRYGETAALFLGTLAVFAVTWLTHAYQWFWILGTWLISLTDTLFWGILALAMVTTLLRETRRGRRTAASGPWSWRIELALAGRTALMFAMLCALWTLWTSPSLESFVALLGAAKPTAAGFAAIAATLAAVALAKLATRRWRPDLVTGTPARGRGLRMTLAAAVPLAGLSLVALPPVNQRLDSATQAMVRDLRTSELNRRDAAQLQRGYYERLVGVNRFNGQLWEVYGRRTTPWQTIEESGAARATGDLLSRELVPLVGVDFRGQPFRTNSLGLRDREYPATPAAGTLRLAVLGSSYTMGYGVGDGEAFESLLEERLNRERPVPGAARYELLNFAVDAYNPISHMMIAERGRVFGPRPHAVVMMAHAGDLYLQDLFTSVRLGRSIPYDTIRTILAAAGVTRDTPRDDIHRRLKPFRSQLVGWAYGRLAAMAAAHGVRVIWVYVPMPRDQFPPSDVAELTRLAREAGFRVLEIGDVYAGHDPSTLTLDPADFHPNAEGHRLIADQVYQALAGNPGILLPDSTHLPR